MFNHINLRSECLSADTERWGKESKRSSSCRFHVPLITLITSLLLLCHLSHPSSKLNNETKKFTHLEALPFLGSSFSCCNSSFFLSSLFHAAYPKGRQNDRLRRTAVRTTVLLDVRSDRCLVTVSLATVRTQKMRSNRKMRIRILERMILMGKWRSDGSSLHFSSHVTIPRNYVSVWFI